MTYTLHNINDIDFDKCTNEHSIPDVELDSLIFSYKEQKDYKVSIDWGNETVDIYHKAQKSTDNPWYWIPFDRLTEGGWLRHLSEKNWVGKELLAEIGDTMIKVLANREGA